jgi:hypothetical protein
MNTEGGRINQLVENARRCSIQERLAKAQNYYGIDSCGTCKNMNLVVKTVQTEGAYLASQVANCDYNYFKPPVVPESVRIERVQREVLDKSNDPLNTNTRFSCYSRIVIPPCPPVDPNIFNGNLPKPARICPALPNTPLNPVLPA